MPKEAHALTHDDIMNMGEYAKIRAEKRKAMTETKKNRRVHIGPDATAYFENYDTMWHQIHEMLHIEQGGAEQVEDELRAYNPLIPNGRELVCTLMFEIDDPDRRARFLAGLGGVEETVTLDFDGESILAVPEEDVDRTSADGKASSIQFLHFPFNDAQAAKFKASDADVVLSIGHEKYGHMVKLPAVVHDALAGDLD